MLSIWFFVIHKHNILINNCNNNYFRVYNYNYFLLFNNMTTINYTMNQNNHSLLSNIQL